METDEFSYRDSVYYGWEVGTHLQYQLTPYYYIAQTTRGDYVLENKDNGAVFLAKHIIRVTDYGR